MNEALFDEREARLRKLLLLNAPRVIIAREALLVGEAFDGGMWRHALAVLAEAFRRTWNWEVALPFWRLACRLNLHHLDQEPGGDGCPFCGKGEPEEWRSLRAVQRQGEAEEDAYGR